MPGGAHFSVRLFVVCVFEGSFVSSNDTILFNVYTDTIMYIIFRQIQNNIIS